MMMTPTKARLTATVLAAGTTLATLALTSGAWAAGPPTGGDAPNGIIAILIGLLHQMGYTLNNTMISGY
jgi:hypothetical protein